MTHTEDEAVMLTRLRVTRVQRLKKIITATCAARWTCGNAEWGLQARLRKAVVLDKDLQFMTRRKARDQISQPAEFRDLAAEANQEKGKDDDQGNTRP